MESDGKALGIAEVSELTKIPSSTLRTWERRHGFPQPVRNERGKRSYDSHTVRKLQLVQQLIGLGHPASSLLKLEPPALEELAWAIPGSRLNEAWTAVLNMDPVALRRVAADHQQTQGANSFVVEFAIPLLRRVGEAWARQEISVAHEHFASQVIEDLSEAGPKLAPDAPTVVLTVLPGEWHDLSLSLAATVLGIRGVRGVVLNEASSAADVAASCSLRGASAVIVVRISQDPDDFMRGVNELRQQLGSDVEVLLGGNVKHLEDDKTLGSLDALAQWAEQRFAA